MASMHRRSARRSSLSRRISKLIPGTYRIQITRVEDTGKERHFTAYVPTTPRGLKELVKRHFCGVPGRRPQYFMRLKETHWF